jgi:hypothetical protein
MVTVQQFEKLLDSKLAILENNIVKELTSLIVIEEHTNATAPSSSIIATAPPSSPIIAATTQIKS